MKDEIFNKIRKLIKNKKINEAQSELSKLGQQYNKDSQYLYLRAEVFYMNELYYIAIDTLLIALEFKESEEVYELLGKIYQILGNFDLSKKILNINLRVEAIKSLKDELTGAYRKEN
tara:strand:- start:21 stop:371 length:351 start_codon:yes stop_codon:yes gene_type:complete